MAKFYHQAIYVDLNTEVELKPMLGGRIYLLIENRTSGASLGDVYLNFDDHADVNNGVVIASGGYYELERVAPDNVLKIRGSTAAGTMQRINVTQGFRD